MRESAKESAAKLPKNEATNQSLARETRKRESKTETEAAYTQFAEIEAGEKAQCEARRWKHTLEAKEGSGSEGEERDGSK